MNWSMLYRTAPSRSFRMALWLWVPLAIISGWLYRDLYSGSTVPAETEHSALSFNIAVNAHFCGVPSALSVRHSVKGFLAQNPGLTSQPLQDVIARQAGSLDEYCRHVVQPVVINDNSLMWLMRSAMWADSRISHDGVARMLGGIALGMVLVFAFAMLYAGASPAFALALTLVACAVLRSVALHDTLYPFVLALPLLGAGLIGIAYCSPATKELRLTTLPAFAGLFGVVTAFSAVMRPVLLASLGLMFALFIVAILRRVGRLSRRSLLTVTGSMAAAFVVAFAFYVEVFVTPSSQTRVVGSTYVYHTFAHPLVLGLGVPESDFSKREGIQWNDNLGIVLARRAIPNTEYLGPTYERALLKYYRSLWRDYPRQMLAVYALKLRSTGDELFLSAAGLGTQFYLPKTPWEWLHRATNGPVLFILALGVLVSALWRLLRASDARMLIVACVAIAVSLSLVESFLTYSIFLGNAFSPLLFFVYLSALLVAQSALDATARPGARWHAAIDALFNQPAVERLGRARVVEALRVAFVLVIAIWWGGIGRGVIVTCLYGVSRLLVRPALAVLATACFVVFATPALNSVSVTSPIPTGSSNLSRLIAQGLSAEHDDALAIVPASYSLAPLAEQHAGFADIIATFPADVLTRMYAAVARVATVPFAPMLRGVALVMVLLAIATAFAGRRYRTLAILMLLVVVAALSGLWFEPDRYGWLEILPWLAIAVAIDGANSWRNGVEVVRASVFAAGAVSCLLVALLALRLYQRDPVRRLLRSYSRASKTELPLRDTKGALYGIAPPAAGQPRVLEIDVNRWACGDRALIEFLYVRDEPAADFSRKVLIPGSSATHAVLRLFEPIASPAFQGLLLPQAADCVASLGWIDASGSRLLPEAWLGPEWERLPMYQRASVETGWFR